jgi:mannose-6-phosphate isomerase-like protein (cupin superfamily)
MSEVQESGGEHVERRGEAAFLYNAHEGAGSFRAQWYFLTRSSLPVAVQSWDLPPGVSEGMHRHGADDPLEELYIVIEGVATMRIAGETYKLSPGDAALARAGEDHDVQNVGEGLLRMIVVWGAPGSNDWSRYEIERVALEERSKSDVSVRE